MSLWGVYWVLGTRIFRVHLSWWHKWKHMPYCSFSRYDPYVFYNRNPELKLALDQIRNGFFSPSNPTVFHDIADVMLKHDRYGFFLSPRLPSACAHFGKKVNGRMFCGCSFFTLADYDDYVKCQDQVGAVYMDQLKWARMSLLNIASSGKFSSMLNRVNVDRRAPACCFFVIGPLK